MIYAITNQKGGVGKSTTANALGACLHRKGYKVLYIDLDAQSNLSYSMGEAGHQPTALEVLTGTATAEDAIRHTPQGDLIPASPALAGADMLITETGKEYRLQEALEPLQGRYDYILIDTPPSLGILTVCALTACTAVIVPTQADIFSLQGIGQLAQTVQAVRTYCNPALTVEGILPTRHNARTNLTKACTSMLEDTANALNTKIFKTPIRECTALKEAQALQVDIYTHKPKSNAAADYEAFTNEILHGSAQ